MEKSGVIMPYYTEDSIKKTDKKSAKSKQWKAATNKVLDSIVKKKPQKSK